MNMKTYLWFAIPAFISGVTVPSVLAATGGEMTDREAFICMISTLVSLVVMVLGGYLQIRKNEER